MRSNLPSDEASLARKMGALYQPDTALVFTMGKVGSTAICRSFDKIGYNYLHFQFLNPTAIKTLMKDNDPDPKYLSSIKTKRYYELIRYHLENSDIGSVQRVITVAREPISYFLSFYFHALDFIKRDIESKHGPITTKTIISHIKSSMDWFHDRRHWSLGRLANESEKLDLDLTLFHYGARNTMFWFDEEFFRYTDVDVYSHDLRGRSWSIISNALILRFEDYPTSAPEKAIQEFIARPNFRLLKENVRENMNYSGIYSDVKSNIRFSLDILQYFYDSRYVANFYTQNEVDKFYERWLEK
jgi:hypothetical protein